MNLVTIPTIDPQELGDVLSAVTEYIPQDLSETIKHAASYIPKEIDLMVVAQFLVFFIAASLIFSIFGRVALGKRSSLNRSLSTVMGILAIYAATVVVYTCKPWDLEAFLSPLPFVSFHGEYLIVLPITDCQFPALCSEILSLVILAFLVNLLDYLIPSGDNALSWFVSRFLSVISSMALHFIVRWAFQTYLPNSLVTYAPAILLVLLAAMLLSGILSFLLGLVIAIANPFLGAMYSFFFSNVVGKQLSKAVFSSAILCGIVYLLEYFGYTVLSVSTASLIAFLPVLLVLLLLWYLIGRVL